MDDDIHLEPCHCLNCQIIRQEALSKMNTPNAKIKKAIAKNQAIYNERKKGTIYCGSPYAIKLNGNVSVGGKGYGKLAVGIENTLKGIFEVLEPDTKEILKEEIDLKNIKQFSVSVCAGDVVQAEFETYEGDWIRCPVSELKVSLDGMRASEFNIWKYKKDKA